LTRIPLNADPKRVQREAPAALAEIVFREPLIVALPETHPAASRAHLELRELSTEPFILFPRSLAPGLYDPIVSLCQQAGFSPISAQEAIQMQTIVSLVAAEMGVAIVPASMQNFQRSGVVYKALPESTCIVAIVPASMQNFQRSGVVYKALPESTCIVAIALIWRSDPTAAVQRFLEVARLLQRI